MILLVPLETRGVHCGLHTGVLLEEIRGQMKVVIEAVQDRPTRGELGDLLKVVTDAIQERPTRAELEVVTEELRGLRRDVAGHAQAAELRALEQRVTVLERHGGV